MDMINRIASKMRDAPKDAVYIWVNQYTELPRRIANDLGRNDLHIEAPYWLQHGWIGKKVSGIILDDSLNLTPEVWKCYERALQSTVQPKKEER